MRWGRENCTVVFILVHSITELHPVYQDNLSLVSTIFKSFTNHTPRLHFWTKKLARFLTHTKIYIHTLQESHLQTWNHIRQTNQRHKNIQTWWWLSLVNHTCVLQATHNPKCLQDQPRSSNNELQLCIVERVF